MAGTVEEKSRGAFFTPAAIADYLSAWAIRSASDSVFEPSCGEAAFLTSAAGRLSSLAGGSVAWTEQLTGVDVHADSVRCAARALGELGFSATITEGDFFEFPTDRRFDVILGNPPFIRYQDFSGVARARSMEAALAQGVRLSGLASSWAAFVVKSAQHLSPGGRLALVLPAELLSVGYAAEVRRFLLRRFAKLKLIAFEERVFPGVLEDVVLLLAEGEGGADLFELHQTRNARTLAEGAAGAETWQPYTPADGGKWTPALVAASAFTSFEDIQAETCENLSAWGRTYLGCVTGNNKFFAIGDDDAARLGLTASDLLRISPPGSRHLRGLGFTEASWSAAAKQGGKVHLFYPASEPSEAALAYIAKGEAAGVSKAYKCRVRAPWWRVPLVDTPDLFLTYMNHDRPRLVTNTARVAILNSLYGVKLHPGRRKLGGDLLPLACLNSVTLLGSEVVGRSYGGGLLKLEPREADKLPVPSLATIRARESDLRAVRPQLGAALRGNDLDQACRLIDPILFPNVDVVTLQSLRAARDFLFQRRRARAGNGSD
jgi:adenine-specific DNA-methyltransferase